MSTSDRTVCVFLNVVFFGGVIGVCPFELLLECGTASSSHPYDVGDDDSGWDKLLIGLLRKLVLLLKPSDMTPKYDSMDIRRVTSVQGELLFSYGAQCQFGVFSLTSGALFMSDVRFCIRSHTPFLLHKKTEEIKYVRLQTETGGNN